jgi:hypothetical protein
MNSNRRSPTSASPYDTAADYGFVAPTEWGQRTSYGKVQRSLEEMLLAEIELDQAVIDYIGFLQDWEVKTRRLLSELELYEKKEGVRDQIVEVTNLANRLIVAQKSIQVTAELLADNLQNDGG